MSKRKFAVILTAALLAGLVLAGAALAADPIKIARVVGITGPLEAYTKAVLGGL